MRDLTQALRWCWHKLLVLSTVIIILLALTLSALRLTMPYATHWKSQIEQVLSYGVNQQVIIEDLDVGWQTFYPRLHLVNTRIENQNEQLFRFGELIIAFNLLESLLSMSIVVHDVTVDNVDLQLERHSNGHWLLNKLPLSQGDLSIPIANADATTTTSFAIPEQFQGVNLKAVNNRLRFIDQEKNIDYLFDGLALSAFTKENSYKIFIASAQPSVLGDRFEAGIDIEMPQFNLFDAKGEVYFNVQNLDVQKLRPLLANSQSIQTGIFTGQVWFDVGDGAQDFLAQMDVQNFSLKGNIPSGDSPIGIQAAFEQARLTGRFVKAQDNYIVYLSELVLNQVASAEANVSKDIYLALSNVQRKTPALQFELVYEQISLSAMSALLEVLPATWLATPIAAAKTSGALSQGFLACEFSQDNQCIGQSMLNNVSLSNIDKLPAISGLSGQFRLREQLMQLQLSQGATSVDYPKYFTAPLNVEQLNANLWLDVGKNIFSARAFNIKDGPSSTSIDMDMQVVISNNKILRPQSRLRLRGQTDNLNINQLQYYLPLKIFNEDFQTWLSNAFISGLATQTRFAADTNFNEYKQTAKNVWQVSSTVNAGQLNFADQWPDLEKASMQIVLTNSGFLLFAKDAEMQGVPLSNSVAWSSNKKQRQMQLALNASGELDQLKQFVQQSPLRRQVEKILPSIDVSGTHTSTVDMQIPFEQDSSVFVDMSIRLNDAALHEKNTDFRYTAIPLNQPLFISETSVATTPFSAYVNGYLADIYIGSESELANDLIYTTMQFASEMPLTEFWPDHITPTPPWFVDIDGQARFQTALRFPTNVNQLDDLTNLAPTALLPHVQIKTNLQGVGSTLPEPLTKLSNDASDIQVDVYLDKTNQVFGSARINNHHAAYDVDFANDSVNINRAHIRLGDNTPASYANKQGLHISGDLPRLNQDAWLAYFAKQRDAQAQQDQTQQSNPILTSLQNIDIVVGDFLFMNQSFQQAQINIQPTIDDWQITFAHADTQGEIRLPKDNSLDKPIVLRFDEITWHAAADKTSTDQDPPRPDEFPLLDMRIAKLNIADLQFSNIALKTSRMATGILIDELSINDPAVNINLQGAWQFTNNGEVRTLIEGDMLTDNLGAAMTNIGYAQLIEGGNGRASINLNWKDSPFNFSLSDLAGLVVLDFEDGDILTIDPGAGRLVSLVSLNKLPRRLLLDFEDVDSKGFFFEKLAGNFNFNRGIATTDNFRIRSSIGRLYVYGDTDLVAQTYAQDLRFFPALSASLPIVGTIIGGGNTGLGILVLDGVARVFGKKLDDFGETRYSVTGAWEEPKIVQIKE